MDASIGSLFFFFQPIVGSLLGWFLLNETLSSNFLLVVFLLYVAFLLLLLKRNEKTGRDFNLCLFVYTLYALNATDGIIISVISYVCPSCRINLNLRQKNTICKSAPRISASRKSAPMRSALVSLHHLSLPQLNMLLLNSPLVNFSFSNLLP